MKKLLFVIFFIFSFVLFFIYTFPVDTVVGYYLNKYSIKYTKIEGNILNFSIEGVIYKQIKVNKINVRPSLSKINVDVNGGIIKLVLLPDKSIDLKVNNAALEDFQLKPQIYGNFNGELSIKIKKKYISLTGKVVSFIKRMKLYPLKNLRINADLKEYERGSKVESVLSSPDINGRFNGEIVIPVRNIKDTVLKGVFKGKVFGGDVNQRINIKIFNLLR